MRITIAAIFHHLGDSDRYDDDGKRSSRRRERSRSPAAAAPAAAVASNGGEREQKEQKDSVTLAREKRCGDDCFLRRVVLRG